ncbi:PREDICTED: uncharacterized protein LOC109216658 [Nicotiana attenuata]|uniref:uncharacterized protein LOC109216658 n=1 Tax=Nicotiana attenuata TaxID=49451 RepID=UPI000904A20B|nr:PREDICTED: uncharacterized protein LOC109216658 [Nicotiana attenuata]
MGILQGLLDILRLGERDSSNIGKQKFLSASFIGGPRDMRQRYMDAIALVQRFGKPDLFITMTCNPTWPEIKEHLWTTDEAQNRPDLISRVFRAKVEELKTDISKRNIFGKVAAYMYTVEFQKRGLPHAHFLIILANEYKLLTSEAYDGIISAELPDANLDKKLRSLVLKHMMHGPCGNLNPTNSRMKKNGLCKFNYPKNFAEHTSKGSDSYPIYKRRNTGEVVKVREQYLDNSWDMTKLHYVHDNDTNKEIDEIKEYQSARWVSPPETAWSLFGFSISEMYPSVYYLQLHLKGQQLVSFKEAKEVFFERAITVSEEDILLHKKLNAKQLQAYNVIIDRVFSKKPGAFFIDGPGGTGKTFLYRALLATVRSKGYIALATATSSVAASILPGGRTVHSRFKIPIDIDENFSCNISKQSSTAGLIRDAKLIVWDEVSMAKKRMLDVFDLLLKDLMDTNMLFGGKVVVFGGDFRQTLPVVRNGKKEDFISESLLYSTIWDELEKLQLSENMRQKQILLFVIT